MSVWYDLFAARNRLQHAHTHLEYRRQLVGPAERAKDPRAQTFRELMWAAEAEYCVALDLLWGVQTRVNP